jgi:xeroderma pigmentosum group C-complementing protein
LFPQKTKTWCFRFEYPLFDLLSAYFKQAYWESAQAANEAEKIKRHERVIRRWTRLVQGLQLRKRLLEDYGKAEVAVSLAADEVGLLLLLSKMLNSLQALPAPGGFLTEYDGVIEHFSLPKTRIMHYHEEEVKSNEEAEPASAYDPHHSWSSPAPERQSSLNEGSPVVGSGANVPKTLRQRATDHYARLNHVQHAPSPVQSKKPKPKTKTKMRLSSNSSASDSETMPSPKRLRRAKVGSSPPGRQLRSGVRKSARHSEKGPS